jgi:hypothetical protein
MACDQVQELMTLALSSYKRSLPSAVTSFWSSQREGESMNGFRSMLAELVEDNGLNDVEIIWGAERRKNLPAFFHPAFKWDFIVLRKSHLLAAIKLNSDVAPTARRLQKEADVAVASALNLWAGYRRGAFGESPRPFVGWLMLVEDAVGSRRAIRDRSDHFPVRPEFQGASYIERYNLLCRKLVQENLYTSAAVLASPRAAMQTGKFSDVSEMTSLKMFVTNFAAHIAAEAAREI